VDANGVKQTVENDVDVLAAVLFFNKQPQPSPTILVVRLDVERLVGKENGQKATKLDHKVSFEEPKMCSARYTQNWQFPLNVDTDRDASCVASVAKKLGDVKLGDTAVPGLQTLIHHEHHKIGADEKNEPAQATSSIEKVEIEDPTDEGKTEDPVQRDPFLFFSCFNFLLRSMG